MQIKNAWPYDDDQKNQKQIQQENSPDDKIERPLTLSLHAVSCQKRFREGKKDPTERSFAKAL
ncbi:hypothetical protein GWA01_05090 [Gluconobacter wancherniae NBRC 103581]|uniref:Uncharacterized protein n=1 Tax=Gluconobacter wancherniae NBRC 103581 TaxID=656744 RepID=A0A511AX08_9PROT|nr:hypothetical protein GWA01_05090 [Gluconobacter wancherniae NBRC 103581]